MTPMTPEQRGAILGALAHREPATNEQVRSAVSDALSVGGHNHQPLITERLRRAERNVPAIVRRLLDAERDIEALRRVLAESVAVAADLPDDGLTADDLLRLYTAAGLDLRADIEHAETLREAEQLAGAR